MSTPADVVRDLARLVDALAKLLDTQTAQNIAKTAITLGAQPQLAQGVDALGRVLSEIRSGAVPLRRAALDRLSASLLALKTPANHTTPAASSPPGAASSGG